MGVLSRGLENQDVTRKQVLITDGQGHRNKDGVMTKYGMTRSSMTNDVMHLRDWALKHPDIPNILQIMTDEWLANQLIMSKNSLARAKRSIESYWRARLVCSELFADRDPRSPAIQRSFVYQSVGVSKGMSSSCYRICSVRFESPDESEFDILAVLRRATLLMELLLKDGIDFAGFILVVDLGNFRLSHLKRIDFTSLSIMSIVMKSYPTSLTKIYIINYPYFIEKVLQLFKPFLSKKIQSRMELTSVEKLNEEFIDILPSDYNGCDDAIKDLSRELEERLLLGGDYIKTIDKMVLERKFTSRHLDVSLSSSFRKLEID